MSVSQAGTEEDRKPGFRFEVMSEKLVDASLKERKVVISKGAKFPNKVGLLQIDYRQKTDQKDLVECDACGAASDLNEPKCPFCGTGEEVPEKPKQNLVKLKKKAPAPTVEVIEAPEAKTEPVEGVEPTVADLNRRVKDIVALKAGAEASAWLLGKRVGELFDLKIWRARTGEKGKPAYANFGQFVKAEIDLSSSQCYRLIDIAKGFTEEQVRKIGSTKLNHVLRLKVEDRSPLVGRIQRENMSVAEVRDFVRAKDTTRRETGRQQIPPGQPGANRKFPEGTVATAVAPGERYVNLYKKAHTGELPEGFPSDQEPARSVDDVPFGVLDLPNNLRLEFQLISGDAGLVLSIATRRIDPLAVDG